MGMHEQLKIVKGDIQAVQADVQDLTEDALNEDALSEDAVIILIRAEDNIQNIYVPADAAADTTWEIPLPPILEAGKQVQGVWCCPQGGIGQATNYMSLKVINKGYDGSGTTNLATVDFNSVTVVPAFTGINIAPTPAEVASGDVLSLKKEVTGDGQAWPGGIVTLILGVPEEGES